MRLRPVELDVAERLDVVAHNAGHRVLGPAEALTPEQPATVHDADAVPTQRVDRAALPHLRAQGDGLLVRVGSTSTRGGTPPYLAPCLAAEAAMDSPAVSCAAEVARFGIDTAIVLSEALASGTNHVAHAGAGRRHHHRQRGPVRRADGPGRRRGRGARAARRRPHRGAL